MSEAPDQERLRRLLSGEDIAWLLDRMRRRLANGTPLSGAVTLSSATHGQRRAVERLLGRRAGTGASLTVSLDELDAVLRRSGAAPDGLADAARLLVGTVPDRVAEAAAWSAVYAPLDELVMQRPQLAPWRTWLDATGMVRRLAPDPNAASVLVTDAVGVLDVLPSGGIALGRLAARTTGDAHGLDDGRPLATLALSAARVLAGSPPAGGGSAAERRAAWAAVGVHRDEVSSTVLCLGLPGGGATMTGRMLALAREDGEPCVLTLRQLGRDQVDLGVGTGLVWVCENPIVLASAADELGPRCPPLVCVNGQPSAAVWRLLNLLVTDGARFSYHGDFDWGGVRIGNALRERIPWQPWRFDAAAYDAAQATGGELTGRPTEATWDPNLRPALQRRGVRVEEELTLPELIDDLRAQAL
jgi:uncharacterized protein (TIGR02679 family)